MIYLIRKVKQSFLILYYQFLLLLQTQKKVNQITNVIKDVIENIEDELISKLSIKINNMRIFKNIINEYLIYKDIISASMDLQNNKESKKDLFSVLILKNVFLKSFLIERKKEGLSSNYSVREKNT
ncbi:YobI family P-loop NTPase [Mycoplasma yeatsii]|uniref:YobI family P-loop NTPase n=1 Tax=Mycoplasma yeatsii TaxID=51365 RepID=UPI0035226929